MSIILELLPAEYNRIDESDVVTAESQLSHGLGRINPPTGANNLYTERAPFKLFGLLELAPCNFICISNRNFIYFGFSSFAFLLLAALVSSSL